MTDCVHTNKIKLQ